nr:hypothetical protein [uncultured Schaedlerella sp.]
MEKLQNIMELFIGNAASRENAPEKSGHLKKYDTAYQTGEYMMLSFTRVDSVTGDLLLVDEDITVIMPADQINGKPYDLRFRAQKLDDVYCVKVTGIESAGKIVYVSHQAARLEKRPEIEKELQKYLSSKEQTPLIVKGKVLRIQTKNVKGENVDTGVWLDLCGVGIPAFIYIGNWKKTFTETLRGKAIYGDVVDVIVLERVERKNGMYYYSCSRKELVQDPWESKELEEKYHKGDIVKIRCLSKRENHWFGEINGLDDIQVFAEYPSQRHDFAIVPGMEYMGTIYYINAEERSLKARVFQALSLEQIAREDAGESSGEEEYADMEV